MVINFYREQQTVSQATDRIKEIIIEYYTPINSDELQMFLGVINYVPDFIQSLSEISTSLRKHTKCFNRLK